jgi:hypothetical protein
MALRPVRLYHNQPRPRHGRHTTGPCDISRHARGKLNLVILIKLTAICNHTQTNMCDLTMDNGRVPSVYSKPSVPSVCRVCSRADRRPIARQHAVCSDCLLTSAAVFSAIGGDVVASSPAFGSSAVIGLTIDRRTAPKCDVCHKHIAGEGWQCAHGNVCRACMAVHDKVYHQITTTRPPTPLAGACRKNLPRATSACSRRPNSSRPITPAPAARAVPKMPRAPAARINAVCAVCNDTKPVRPYPRLSKKCPQYNRHKNGNCANCTTCRRNVCDDCRVSYD